MALSKKKLADKEASVDGLMDAMNNGGKPIILNADENAIIPKGDAHLLRGGKVKLEVNAAKFASDVTYDEWLEVGKHLAHYQSAIQFMLGDWANYGFQNAQAWDKYDADAEEDEGKYAALLEATNYSYSSLTKFASVCDRLPVFRRRKISYSVHLEIITKYDREDKQDEVIALAEKDKLSVRDIRDMDKKKTTKLSVADKVNKETNTKRKAAKRWKPETRQQVADMYEKLAEDLRNMK